MYKLTSSRSHLTLANVSGRTKTNGKESRMAVLFSTTRGVSCRRNFFSRFSHLNFFHSQQLSLVKCITRSQTVTRSAEEVTYGFPRGIKSSEEAELAYPPKSMVLSRLKGVQRAQSYKISFNSKLAPQTAEIGFSAPPQMHSACLKNPKSTLFS